MGPGAAPSVPGIQEELRVVDQVTQMKDDSTCGWKVMTRAQKARTMNVPKCLNQRAKLLLGSAFEWVGEGGCPRQAGTG